MIRVRKQIERLERGCMITVHLQPAQVTRQGCRIARHVHYLLGTQTWHLVDHVGGASARRIEDDHIPTRASAQQVTNACASRRADEASVGETGPCRVRLRVSNRSAILLDADEFSRLAGERETQVSRATVKFDYSLFFLYVTQLEQGSDERPVARQVHLCKHSLAHCQCQSVHPKLERDCGVAPRLAPTPTTERETGDTRISLKEMSAEGGVLRLKRFVRVANQDEPAGRFAGEQFHLAHRGV